MSLNTLNNITPLSRTYTHQMLASEVMVLTNTNDNENIQLANVRNHINLAVSHVAELLNLASTPWYGIYMNGVLDNPAHASGLDWIDLSATNFTIGGVSIMASLLISEIKRISFGATQGISNAWVGNCSRMDISQLLHQANQLNVQHNLSVFWNHHGTELLFFAGKQIQTPAHNVASAYTLIGTTCSIFAYRSPLLDDLTPPLPTSTFVTNKVDIPDRYIRLVVLMAQKMVLEQLNMTAPEQLEAQIQQGVASITQGLQAEIQMERSERDKQRYGVPQRNM